MNNENISNDIKSKILIEIIGDLLEINPYGFKLSTREILSMYDGRYKNILSTREAGRILNNEVFQSELKTKGYEIGIWGKPGNIVKYYCLPI